MIAWMVAGHGIRGGRNPDRGIPLSCEPPPRQSSIHRPCWVDPAVLRCFLLPVLIWACNFLAGCAGTAPYAYRYIPGKTATLENGCAVAPASAPAVVHTAIAAGNRIAGLPYGYGCGHTREPASAYDCSGAASFVLCEAGLLDEATTSHAFRRYGSGGEGRWISVYARRGHVFLVVAGLRFDTGYGTGANGPRWTTRSRPAKGAVIRHPSGL